LGTTVTNQNLINEEIKRRLNSVNACYRSVQNSSCLLSKNGKIRVKKTIILPEVLNGCETLSLTLTKKQTEGSECRTVGLMTINQDHSLRLRLSSYDSGRFENRKLWYSFITMLMHTKKFVIYFRVKFVTCMRESSLGLNLGLKKIIKYKTNYFNLKLISLVMHYLF
jgi:hypothetical protein